jgi:NLR family CARD domain-containing protein 3
VGDEGVAALGAALEGNATLTELDMEHNRIGEEGATLLLKALREFNTTLTELYLSGNDAISRTSSFAIQEIVDVNKTGLRLLHTKTDLSSKHIGNATAKRIAMDLADNTTVATLILSENVIEVEGALTLPMP